MYNLRARIIKLQHKSNPQNSSLDQAKCEDDYYRILIDNCPMAFIISREGKVIYVNSSCLEMFGYDSTSDFRGTSMFDHITPEYRADVVDKVSRRFQGEDVPRRYITWGLKSDGSSFPFEVEVSMLDLPDGKASVAFITDVTDHMEAENALKASEARWRSITQNSPDHIMMLDQDFNIQFINYTVPDLTTDQVLGTPIINYIPKEYHTQTLECLRKVLASGAPGQFDVVYTGLHSQRLYFEARVSAIKQKNQVMSLLVSARNVTDRLQAEEQVRKSEIELKAILNSLQDTYYRVDTDGNIIKASPSVKQLLGYTVEEVLKINVADLYADPGAREKFLQELVKQNGVVSNYQAQLKCKDNSTIWVSSNAHFVKDLRGNVTGIEGVTRDITSIKQSEEALIQSTAKLKAIFNAISDAVIFVDPKRQIVMTNPAVTRLFGYENDELLGKTTELLYANSDDFKTQGTNRFSSDSPLDINLYEVLYRRKDDSIFIGETFGTKVQDENGNLLGFIGIIRDVTERKRIEDKLRLSQKIFDDTAKAILVTDARTNICDTNNAFNSITNYRKEELMGKPISAVFSPRHSLEFYNKLMEDVRFSGYWQGEIWNRKRNGEEYPNWVTISAVMDENERPKNYVAILSDISTIKATEERLDYLAHYDQLTGLPNRTLFNDHLQSAIARAKRHRDRVAVMYADLDGFKQINDTLGHAEGDKLLVEIGLRLKNCVRDEDTVARLGGDEFAIIINQLQSISYLHVLAKRIINELAATRNFDGRELRVSGSVGIAMYPYDGDKQELLLRHADQAMYHAKQKGKNNYQFFDSDMNVRVMNRIRLESDLHKALGSNEFYVEFQPKYNINEQTILGAEALVRWNHPERSVVKPLDFIPLAEDSDLIIKLGNQVLNKACQCAKMWNSHANSIPVAVNISTRQFKSISFIADIESALRNTGLSPELLEIEITESLLMDDIESAVKTLYTLKNMGLRISIDDFGVGYSSLYYLKKLPVDTLKIDRSFISDMVDDNDDKAIISAIVSLASSLNLQVIAEGVENNQQLDMLKALDCCSVQGFLFAKPMKNDEFVSLLTSQQELVTDES